MPIINDDKGAPAELKELLQGREVFYIAEHLWGEPGAPQAIRAKHGGRIVARLPRHPKGPHRDPTVEDLAALAKLHDEARARARSEAS